MEGISPAHLEVTRYRPAFRKFYDAFCKCVRDDVSRQARDVIAVFRSAPPGTRAGDAAILCDLAEFDLEQVIGTARDRVISHLQSDVFQREVYSDWRTYLHRTADVCCCLRSKHRHQLDVLAELDRMGAEHPYYKALADRVKDLIALYEAELSKKDAELDSANAKLADLDSLAHKAAKFALAESRADPSNRLPAGNDGVPLEDKHPGKKVRAKRSTEKGEGRAKLIAALTKHHKHADGGCLNSEPIGNNELADLAAVDKATASAFFKRQFQGHGKYKALCRRDTTKLAAMLKLLNGEYPAHLLYGAMPPDEDDRNAD